MTKVFDGVRRGDVALAVALTALGVLLMVANVQDHGSGTRIDSHSWWAVPLFALATVPVLWRRRDVLAVTGVSLAAMGVHVLAFGWMVRCGAGLPLAFALAYAVGRLGSGWRSGVGLVLALALQAVVLVHDSAAGFGVFPVTALLGVAVWGTGVALHRPAGRGTPVPQGASEPVGA